MRVRVFQHDPADGPGYLGEALARRGATLDIVRLDQGQAVPDSSNYDLLLIMGGVMNVYQEVQYPWLADEARAVRRAVADGKAVLGVCLGGQLLARALGAKVHLNAAREVGLVPIRLAEAGRADPIFAGLPGLEAVEWHDDTFDVPDGAVALASSERCANQAFRYGEKAYGLQFHPEVSPAMLAEWLRTAGDHPPEDGQNFQRAVEDKAEALRAQADRLIENLLGRVGPK